MSSNPLSTGTADDGKNQEWREHERRHSEASDQAERISAAAISRENNHSVMDDLIVAQTEAVGKLALGITKFAEQYNVAEYSRRKDRRVYLVLIGSVLLIALIVGAGVIRINHLQTITTTNSQINRDNGQVVRDCVQPTGQCYKDNQQRTADTIKKIVDSNQNGQIDTKEILDAINEANKAKGLPPQ